MMRIVAEMMIYANSAVAERIYRAFPRAALLRRHPPPRQQALAEVRRRLGAQRRRLRGQWQPRCWQPTLSGTAAWTRGGLAA
jgi:exoribonuclease R